MKIASSKSEISEGDMTPMIDMVFQLIAFFMVLINFGQTESNDRVVLPSSVLVKPPEGKIDFPIILHIAQDGEVILGGNEYTAQTLKIGLNQEMAVLTAEGKKPGDANIIIRAHKDTAAGDVQEIIRAAQDQKFERFALRAKEDRS